MGGLPFDLAIQLHGSGGLTNQILLLLNAVRSAGFHAKHCWCPDPRSWWPYPEDEHEIHRNLRLIQYLGAPSGDTNLEFPLTQADRDEADAWKCTASMGGQSYVCLHAGARKRAKRWPASMFALVGDALAQRGFQIVLTGSEVERPLAAAVAQSMCAPAINLACGMSIGGMAALMAGARLVISNDTGAAHLAVAVDTPTVVIFFATDVQRWAPLDRQRHLVVADPAGVTAGVVLAKIDAWLSCVE